MSVGIGRKHHDADESSRAMAEETVDAAIKEFGLLATGPSQTDHIKLIGGHAWTKTMYIKLIQQFGLETEVAKHLAESYGDQAWTVASMCSPTGWSSRALVSIIMLIRRTRFELASAWYKTLPIIPLHRSGSALCLPKRIRHESNGFHRKTYPPLLP